MNRWISIAPLAGSRIYRLIFTTPVLLTLSLRIWDRPLLFPPSLLHPTQGEGDEMIFAIWKYRAGNNN